MLLAAAFTVPGASAQDVSIDRWLVSSAEVATSQNPLQSGGAAEFPDRDLEVGPGSWTLIRSDGETRFDFSDQVDSGHAGLAHAYVRSPSDANFRLSISGESCASVSAWVNGQPLLEGGGAREVRLAGGWNTLFAVVDGDAACPRSLSASFSRSRAPDHQDATVPVSDLRVQASRPPGVRQNYPDGTVTAGAPEVTRFSWNPGRDDLDATVDYSVTAWGRDSGGRADAEEERGTPTVDLSGEWELTVYGPTGIQELRARFEMEEDGTLRGDIRRDQRDLDPRRAGRQFGRSNVFEGEIRDGWVSGSRFGWTLRVSGQRGGELRFSGEVRDGELSGPIEIDGFRDVDSRFEARRGGETGSEIEAEAQDPVEEAAVPEVPGAATQERRTGPSDASGQRRQMVAFLLGSPPAKASAPSNGSVRLSVSGESLTGAADGLVSATPHRFEGIVPFKKAREAALGPDGVEAEVRWDRDDYKAKGQLVAASLLEAFHGPITLGGLMDRGDDVATGTFRIPDVLGGFTLRGLGARWWVNGVEAAGGVLCDPCQRGQQIELGFQGADSETAQVEISSGGYPDSAASGPTAIEWLRALEGDNRKYRELAAS